MKKLNIILIIVVGFLFVYCSNKPIYVLPQRNLDVVLASTDSINSPENEIAPYLRVSSDNCAAAFNKESQSNFIANSSGMVKPSQFFFKEILGEDFASKNKNVIDYLTTQLESAVFLTNNSGFVSLSHPPDENYTKIMNLPFIGGVGGTDLFSFSVENGKYVFRSLPQNINSDFWDSHPWVGQDENCNLVMIWASDRDNPYSATKALDKKVIRRGNSDLFYAFRIGQTWTNPVKLPIDSKINTDEFNEISPFVACVNISPKLLFSSNRNGDYDIFEANLKIDFAKREITVVDDAKMLPKGKQYEYPSTYINTEADEMFPLVAFPYNSNSSDKELFLSSNRNNAPRQLYGSDSALVSKGGFDLYMFNYAFECKIPPPPPPPPPPSAMLKFKVIDQQNASRMVIEPIVKIIEVGSGKEHIERSANFSYKLQHGKEYDIYAGSEHNSLVCDVPGDTLIKFYKTIQIKEIAPDIRRRETIKDYDSVANPTLFVAYDTTYKTEIMPISQSSNVSAASKDSEISDQNTRENIVGVNYVKCPPKDKELESKPREPYLEVTKQIINKREWYEGGKVIKKQMKLISFDTIPRYDTTVINAIGAVGKSELTHLGRIKVNKSNRDTVISDMIYLDPVYFVKPKCSVDFVDIKSNYNKNVPYYQTAFWRVNTSDGLEKHLSDFQEGSYLERAGFIELHPKHRKFGVWNSDVRAKRMKDYRDYAKDVDKNLIGMRNEITQHFIPAMDELLKLSPDTKLLIKLEAYSDIRDAGNCFYIGSKIEYLQGKIDNDGNVNIKNIEVANQATLSADNENLSKLRVFYGFAELFKLLRWDKNFNRYFNEDLVFYPTQKFDSKEKMLEAMKKAKIIILAEGKNYDKVVKENELDYDPIRRLNMHIQVIKFSAEKIIQSPCCQP